MPPHVARKSYSDFSVENNLRHLTERVAASLFADRTRRADIDPKALCDAHTGLGAILASEFVERLETEAYDIHHCQGMRSGVRVKEEGRIGICPLLRAGLYLAHGFRDLLRLSPMVMLETERGKGVAPSKLDEIRRLGLSHVVLIDAVVNTGASIVPIFAQMHEIGVRRVTIIAGVAPFDRATALAREHPSVDFIYARLSHNTYVGKGGTDTGNRLFGTEGLD